jgi:hypothetical protein
LIVFAETVSICWIYGVENFQNNIQEMFNVRPNIFWKICWKYLAPVAIFLLFIISIVFFEAPVVGSYEYPKIYLALGWIINCSIMFPIPMMIVYVFIKKKYLNNNNNNINNNNNNNEQNHNSELD